MLEQKIKLRPDRSRPSLKSRISKRLADGIVDDSITLDYNPWIKGEMPRVLLIIPPYSRISRSLELILQNLERDETDKTQLSSDRQIVSEFYKYGITHIDEMKRAGMPMGLLRIGTAAKRAGYDVKILDAVFEGWTNERRYFENSEGSEIISYGLTNNQIADRIKLFKPHIVGISIAYTHQWGNARELADLVKQIDEKIPIIMGGTHAHGLPADVLLDSPTDYVVFGQTDVTFPELLDIISGREAKDVSSIKGIAYKKNGMIEQTEKRDFFSRLDSIAIPDLSLINLGLYSGRFHSAGERQLDDGYLLYGFTTIGCNTRCTFCTIPNIQGPWLSIGKQQLNRYLEYIKSQGVCEFIIEDDHLLHDPTWAMTVFNRLGENNLPYVCEGGLGLFSLISLLPEVSEDFVTERAYNPAVLKKTLKAKREGLTAEHLIQTIASTGCYNVYLAVESANDESLTTSHKPKLNAEEEYAIRVVRLLADAGIKTTAGLMLGFINPNGRVYVESRSQIEKSIAYGQILRRAGASFVNPFIFTPLPGAPHFDRLIEYAVSNTDIGYSHEFATIDAPNGEWTRDELNLLRAYSIIKTNGIKDYLRIINTGTWPVERTKLLL